MKSDMNNYGIIREQGEFMDFVPLKPDENIKVNKSEKTDKKDKKNK